VLPYSFRSERLGMRPWRMQDLPAFHRIFGDDRVIWWRDHERDLEASRAALQLAIGQQGQPRSGLGRFAVVLPGTGEVVGNVIVRPAAFADDVEVGYHVRFDDWGHGYATEAALAALGHGFGALALPRIVAAVAVNNARSLRVMDKLPMRPTHEADYAGRRHRVFELARAEWLAHACTAAPRP